MFALGTRYHPEDLYNHLMKEDKEFKDSTYIIPAIVDGESQMPEVYPLEDLEDRLDGMGQIFFDSQYMLSTDSMSGDIFDYAYFRWYERSPGSLRVYAGVDLALGQKMHNDYFAIVVIGIDGYSNIFVLDWFRGRLSLQQQNKKILSMFQTWDPIKIGIEANAFQGAKLQELKNHHEEEYRVIRAVPIFTKEDKVTRGQKLAVEFERGNVFLPDGRSKTLENELCAMPNGSHDDLFDALWLAVRTARVRTRKRTRDKEPGLIGAG